MHMLIKKKTVSSFLVALTFDLITHCRPFQS